MLRRVECAAVAEPLICPVRAESRVNIEAPALGGEQGRGELDEARVIMHRENRALIRATLFPEVDELLDICDSLGDSGPHFGGDPG